MNLRTYLDARGLSAMKLAAGIGVTPVAAARYAQGTRFPRPAHIIAIQRWTKGEVTANDLLEAWVATRAKAAAKAKRQARKAAKASELPAGGEAA